jgi:ATP adenylyltransferase
VLLENVGAAVIPSVGALVPGHVLVCTKPHVRSFAAAPAGSQEALWDLSLSVIALLECASGNPVHAFEHGSPQAGTRVACSVEHAHLHVLPAAVSVHRELAEIGNWVAIGDAPEAVSAAVGAAEYLLYRDPAGQRFVALAPREGFPSQLMRRVFADAVGTGPHWDWRRYPAHENVVATIDMFEPQRLPLAVAHG